MASLKESLSNLFGKKEEEKKTETTTVKPATTTVKPATTTVKPATVKPATVTTGASTIKPATVTVKPTVTVTPAKKTVEEVAKEVIEGKYGNGEERKAALAKAGYDYAAVQARVNELLK